MTDLFPAAGAAKPLFITKLIAENVKKLRVVSITPDGKVVQIAGQNGEGKTTVLDTIWWALGGASAVQSEPIRKGENFATIKLELGDGADSEFIVTRRFQRTDDGDFTTSVKVTTPDGAQFGKPQDILNRLAGDGGIAFDPSVFGRLKPKEQLEALRRFVPGLDFEKIDGLNRADFDKRTGINREAAQKKSQAQAIEIPEAMPKERVDENAIVDRISSAGEHNGEIENRKLRREQAADSITSKRTAAQAHRDRAADLRRQADQADQAATTADTEADTLQKKLDEAAALPEPMDIVALKAELEQAKRTNALIDRARQRETLLAEATDLEQQAEALTAAIAKRNDEKRAQIAAAKMPVEGLGFGEDCITFKGVPFDQASAAEKLRVAIGIAMAGNARLKVILCRDASLLDKKSMQILAEMAEQHGFQVWIETVDDSGEIGIVMEDGSVVSTPATRRGRKAPVEREAAE